MSSRHRTPFELLADDASWTIEGNAVASAAFIQSAAADYTAAAMAQQIRAGLEDLAAALNNNLGTIAENVGSDHPLQPESVDTLRGSLDALAESTQKIAAILDIVSKRMQAED
jgi:hypothetical protein